MIQFFSLQIILRPQPTRPQISCLLCLGSLSLLLSIAKLVRLWVSMRLIKSVENRFAQIRVTHNCVYNLERF